jgi:hypothetical protein
MCCKQNCHNFVAIIEDLIADIAGMHDKNNRKEGWDREKVLGVARSMLASLEMYSTMITKFNYFRIIW